MTYAELNVIYAPERRMQVEGQGKPLTLDDWLVTVRNSNRLGYTFDQWVKATGELPQDVARAVWDFGVKV